MIRYVKSSPSPWSTAGRSGLISFRRTSSPSTDSSPSRRNSALKPISSGSPVNAAGSDSRASPTSCVRATPSARPRRSAAAAARCAGPSPRRGGRRRAARRAGASARARTPPAAAAGSSGTGRRSGASSARRRRCRRPRGSRARRSRPRRPRSRSVQAPGARGRDDRLELGQRALERRLLDREPVGVGRRHHELAALEADEDPGQHRPRLVARGGAADPADRLEQRLALDGARRESRRPRAAAGSPRGRRCAAVARAPEVTCTTDSSGRCSIVDLVRRQQRARCRASVLPGSTTRRRLRPAPRAVARSESSMSVAASRSSAVLRLEQDPREDLHGRARRDGASDDPETLRRARPGARDPQPGADHGSSSII